MSETPVLPDFHPDRHVRPELVRKARAMTGQSAKEAGADVGHTARAWHSWEGGQRKMRREILDAYLEIHGLGTGFDPDATAPSRVLDRAATTHC